MTEEEYLNRRAMAQGNVPEPQPVTVNPSTGGIQPVKQSGLYAIYNQRNPYSAQAERLSAMSGRDMGGRLGQLPGIVATLMAGRANRKSEEFEAQRQSKLEAIMASNYAWEKIQNDKEAQLRDIKLAKELVEPKAAQAYIQKYNETKDLDLASDFAAQAYNSAAKEANLTALPVMTKFTMWDGGEATAIWNDATKTPVQGKIDKNGNLAKMNEKGQFVPVDQKDMLFSVYNTKEKTDSAKARAAQGPSQAGMLEYYDANDNLVAKTKNQAEAIAAGAVSAGRWVKTVDENGNDSWKMEKVPLSRAPKKPNVGDLNRQGAPASSAPAKAQQVSAQYQRPNPVPGSPGSGQAAPVPAPATVAQPQMVRVVSPDGVLGSIPANKLQAAIAAGYKQVR